MEVMKSLLRAALMLLPATLVTLAVAGCTTWGSKTPMGPSRYAPTNFQQVRILWSDPSEPHEEIGLVSVLGGAAFITQETDMLRKLQKSAADLGADAVIIVREGATRNVTAGGGGSSSGWGFGASSLEYPRNLGRAIKYRNPALQIPPRTRR
jgi:hypothetical protein